MSDHENLGHKFNSQEDLSTLNYEDSQNDSSITIANDANAFNTRLERRLIDDNTPQNSKRLNKRRVKSRNSLNQNQNSTQNGWSRGDLINFQFDGTNHAQNNEPAAWYAKFSTYTLEKCKSGYVDSHCHIDYIYKRLKINGSTSLDDYWKKNEFTIPEAFDGAVVVFCEPYAHDKFKIYHTLLQQKNLVGIFGCHPHSAHQYTDELEASICRVLKNEKKAVAVGEIGLDYTDRSPASRELQQQVFSRQIKIAIDNDLPICIHCRDAEDDLHLVLGKCVPSSYKMHRHCFTEGPEAMQRLIDKYPNMYFGFTNLVTNPSASKCIAAARQVPLNRLLLETDAPFFVPHDAPKSVKISEPFMAIKVAEKIASLRNIRLDEVLRAVRKNTKQMYTL